MHIRPFLSVAAVVFSIGAVHAAEPTSPAPAGVSKPAAQAAKPTVKTRGLVRTQKSRMGVRIDYTVDSLTAGAPGQVVMTVTRPDSGPPLDIEVQADPTLTWVTPLPANKASQTLPVASYRMALTPQGNGLHYLHVFLRQGASAEALAIPLQVGKGNAVANPSKAVTMPDGQRVISMPAQQ